MQTITRAWLALLFVMLPGLAHAQYSTQAITLTKGWNTLFLEVQPDAPTADCNTFFADWPVSSVSVYIAGHSSSASPEFLAWIPGIPAGANSLNALLGGKSYLIFATNTFTRVVTGRPVVPRIEWFPSSAGTNVEMLVGFRTDGTAHFGTYLAGAGFDLSKMAVYTVGGTNPSGPTFLRQGFSGVSSLPITPGKAYFMTCDKASTFSGPVTVSPAGSEGLSFSSNAFRRTLSVKNTHADTVTVTVAVQPSALTPAGTQPTMPTLFCFDMLTGWTNWAGALAPRILAPAQEWTLPVAVDRSGMMPGQPYGAVVVCSDTAGGRVEVPLEVEYAAVSPSHALWPAGLWVGEARLDKVSQVLNDHLIKDGVGAGGPLQVRLILHVATDGHYRLLQRVILAGEEDTNGNWNAGIYLNETNVPPGLKTVRISSVAFGLKNDIQYTAGSFGDSLQFAYTIADNDPVNPFRHPYHPDHDGLGHDFQTPLPSGDNPANYATEEKPELFSISNTVELAWTGTPSQAGGGSAGWNPSESTSGTILWKVMGLRREGDIQMQGSFELRRISQLGTISTY